MDILMNIMPSKVHSSILDVNQHLKDLLCYFNDSLKEEGRKGKKSENQSMPRCAEFKVDLSSTSRTCSKRTQSLSSRLPGISCNHLQLSNMEGKHHHFALVAFHPRPKFCPGSVSPTFHWELDLLGSPLALQQVLQLGRITCLIVSIN